jgi:hypothetical protein
VRIKQQTESSTSFDACMIDFIRLKYIISPPFLHQFHYFDLLCSPFIICRYLDVIFLYQSLLFPLRRSGKSKIAEKQEIISPMTFIPHIIFARREVRRCFYHLKQGISNDFMYGLSAILSLLYILRMTFYVFRDVRRSKSHIPEVVISIYDVYELEKSGKESKMITHLLKGLKDEML